MACKVLLAENPFFRQRNIYILENILKYGRFVLDEETKKWLNKADSDLKHAGNALGDNDLDWAELASQQSAEKALKAVCIQNGFGLIKTHDLTILARKVKAPLDIVQKGGLLNPFYTSARYPDVEELMDAEANKEAAKDAVKAAKAILQWCKKQLKLKT